jgi:hypothetical protein
VYLYFPCGAYISSFRKLVAALTVPMVA